VPGVTSVLVLGILEFNSGILVVLDVQQGDKSFAMVTMSHTETLHQKIYNMRSNALGVISILCRPSLGPID
jgi:hypothetical protein